MMDWRDEYDAAIAERNRLIMALTAAEKRAEAAEKRVAELEEGIRAIDNAVAIQCSDGNWNYDPYMHGMANGLLLAQTYMAHPTGAYDAEHYKPLSAPERWLSDVAPTPPPAATE